MKLKIELPKFDELKVIKLDDKNIIQIARAGDDFIENLYTIRHIVINSSDNNKVLDWNKISNIKEAKKYINNINKKL